MVLFLSESWKFSSRYLGIMSPVQLETLQKLNDLKMTSFRKLALMHLSESKIHGCLFFGFRYLLQEKKRGKALDSVANFHLQNGAVCHANFIFRDLKHIVFD